MQADPNAVYDPVMYPKALYATASNMVLVHSQVEETQRRAEGYGDFTEIDPERDGLENTSHEHLIDMMVEMVKIKLKNSPTPDVVELVREWKRRAADEAAAAQALSAPEPEADPDAAEQPQDLAEPSVALTGDALDDMAAETAEEPEAPAPIDLTALDDDALRALIKEHTGKSPHPKTGHNKLLAAAQALTLVDEVTGDETQQ